MNKQTLISFVIPSYNSENHLNRCLDSILNQGLPTYSYEIIVVNDGSTDKTLEIVEREQRKTPVIKIVSQNNQGLAAARNTGINNASGDYLWFLDSDDYLFPNTVQILIKKATEEKLDIITFDYEVVNSMDLKNNIVQKPLQFSLITSGLDYLASTNYPNYCWKYFLKRNLVQNFDLKFNAKLRYWEDVLFTTQIFLAAKKIIKCNLCVVAYVQTPNSLSRKGNQSKESRQAEDFLTNIRDFDLVISGQSQYGNLPNATLQRIKSRQQSFVFFLSLRLWRKALPLSRAQEIYEILLKENRIPFYDFSFEEYRGARYLILRAIINTPWLFKLIMRVVRWF